MLLRRRPPRGLLGGMTELPGTAWGAAPLAGPDALAAARRCRRNGGRSAGCGTGCRISSCTLDVLAARVPAIAADGFLADIAALEAEALPSVMRKCAALAMAGQ